MNGNTPMSVAVIGLGGMGSGMARALLSAGHPVTVFNRTRSKAEPLVEAGATLADTAAKAVPGADVVLLSLADEPAVEQVLFGQLLDQLRTNQRVVDTSTVSPEFARSAQRRLAAHDLHRVEACVVGNPPMAAAGALRVFAAGDPADVAAVRPVLDTIGQSVVHLGDTGRASSLKLAFNLLLGVQTAGLAEAVVLAEAQGLDRTMFLDAVDGSGWRSPVLSFRARYMRDRDYHPAGFRAALMHKDLLLAQTEAASFGFALPVTERAGARFEAAVLAGRGDEDAAVVVDL
jgi:3-hydroxyisobutyrate dehydrogenase-like beta-hydroxyacid dehydrogenase